MNTRSQDRQREKAIDHMRKKQFDKALPLFEELLEDGEQDSSLYYMAGQCCRFMNKIDDAIQHLEQAATLIENPDQNKDNYTYNVFLALGIALQLAQRYDESVEELKKAVQLKPPQSSACNSLGLTYNLMGKYSDAIDSYSEALERHVNEVIDRLEADTGGTLTNTIDVRGAKTAMLNTEIMDKMPDALRSEPTYAILQNNLGGVYLEAGNLDEAKEKFEESIRYLPEGYDYPPPYIGLETIVNQSKST